TTLGGSGWVDDLTFQNLGLTAVDDAAPATTINLRRISPNPFSPSTRIEFAVPRRGPVDIAVYDVSGRRVATLLHGDIDAGVHDVVWNGKNSQGASVAAGVYWTVVKTSEGQKSRSMVLMK
ncbi:MAG TPA: FlgD immunoglobulin-like domain containing protein, partial [Candidatus Eisenbacteria bacterium]